MHYFAIFRFKNASFCDVFKEFCHIKDRLYEQNSTKIGKYLFLCARKHYNSIRKCRKLPLELIKMFKKRISVRFFLR